MAPKRAHTHTRAYSNWSLLLFFERSQRSLLTFFFYWYLQFDFVLLPPAYRCKLFSICIHVVNRQRFVFIFVFFRALATYIQIKDFMWAAHTHLPTTYVPIYILICVHVCLCVWIFTCLITTLSCLSSLLRLRCCCADNRSNPPG